jgi:hypothetical protein
VHVDAARAAVAPSVANPNRPYDTFKALFDQACTEPKLPDTMRTNDRSAVVPRKEWFTFPVEIFDNLHFIGIDSKGNVYSAEVQGKRVQKFRNLGGL